MTRLTDEQIENRKKWVEALRSGPFRSYSSWYKMS